MKIENNKYVAVTYNLIVGEADGEATIMESATANRPLEFIPGLGMMLPKFEENLLGLEQGAKFDFTMSPDDAYGQHDPERVASIPFEIFQDEKGKIDFNTVAVDHTLPMMAQEGNTFHGTVTEIDQKKKVVVMDFNHPLAGETLHFVGEVMLVRECTAEEMAAATQPHTCGGCGGGCKGGCGSKDNNEGGCCGGEGGCCGK